MQFIYQLADWPKLRWDERAIAGLVGEVRHAQGKLAGKMQMLGFPLEQEAVLATLTEDVLKSSEIEGEILSRDQVRSSVARRLGMDIGALAEPDREVEGVVEMMLDATQSFAAPLSDERLFAWHSALFPTGRSGMTRIQVGAWRDDTTGPMQVVSGPYGRQKIHFEAPAGNRMPAEMAAFLAWYNVPSEIDAVVKAAIAHLWFVTIHPFEDGNGRIARAIADMSLARSEASPRRFYSMSAQIRAERNAYYAILEKTQSGDLDCTEWLLWFLHCLARAITGAEATLASVLHKHAVWERIKTHDLNDRQRLLINRLLDGYEGKLTTKKAALHVKASHDTALRDIEDLIKRGILQKDGAGGRSTSYSLVAGSP